MEPKPVNEINADTTGEHLWPMGAVTRRTGIGEHTLRALALAAELGQPELPKSTMTKNSTRLFISQSSVREAM